MNDVSYPIYDIYNMTSYLDMNVGRKKVPKPKKKKQQAGLLSKVRDEQRLRAEANNNAGEDVPKTFSERSFTIIKDAHSTDKGASESHALLTSMPLRVSFLMKEKNRFILKTAGSEVTYSAKNVKFVNPDKYPKAIEVCYLNPFSNQIQRIHVLPELFKKEARAVAKKRKKMGFNPVFVKQAAYTNQGVFKAITNTGVITHTSKYLGIYSNNASVLPIVGCFTGGMNIYQGYSLYKESGMIGDKKGQTTGVIMGSMGTAEGISSALLCTSNIAQQIMTSPAFNAVFATTTVFGLTSVGIALLWMALITLPVFVRLYGWFSMYRKISKSKPEVSRPLRNFEILRNMLELTDNDWKEGMAALNIKTAGDVIKLANKDVHIPIDKLKNQELFINMDMADDYIEKALDGIEDLSGLVDTEELRKHLKCHLFKKVIDAKLVKEQRCMEMFGEDIYGQLESILKECHGKSIEEIDQMSKENPVLLSSLEKLHQDSISSLKKSMLLYSLIATISVFGLIAASTLVSILSFPILFAGFQILMAGFAIIQLVINIIFLVKSANAIDRSSWRDKLMVSAMMVVTSVALLTSMALVIVSGGSVALFALAGVLLTTFLCYGLALYCSYRSNKKYKRELLDQTDNFNRDNLHKLNAFYNSSR